MTEQQSYDGFISLLNGVMEDGEVIGDYGTWLGSIRQEKLNRMKIVLSIRDEEA